MGARNTGLTADVLFVGATRPPMRWGVTYAALMSNLVFTMEAFLLTRNLLTILVCLPIHGVCALLCARDPRFFDLILRCSGSEHGGTSQFASRLIGEREVLRVNTSRSRRAIDLFPSVTRAEHLSVESAVMGAEIEQLPDLSGYLKIASHRQWLRVGLRPMALANPSRAAQPTTSVPRLRGPVAAQREGLAAADGMEAGPL